MKTNSDLDSADIADSKFFVKSSGDVTTSALLSEILLEVNHRGRFLNQSVIDASATF